MERLDRAVWRKSSYSGTSGNNCVEVAESAGAVIVRDTANRAGTGARCLRPMHGGGSRTSSGNPARHDRTSAEGSADYRGCRVTSPTLASSRFR